MIHWGIDQYFLEKQAKRSTAYIDLPASFSTFTLKEKVSFMTATMKHNVNVLTKYLHTIAKMPANRRMYRIPLQCFPHYFNRNLSWLYKDIDYRNCFFDIGKFCRKHKIRISVHAPMNVYIGIDSPWNWFALNRLGLLFRELGYETPYQDGACFCVHSTYSHFSAQDINRLVEQNIDRANLAFCAVENTHAENSLYENLELENVAKIVDLHHHLIANGKYLSSKSKLWLHVKKSWNGETPKIHLSTPRLENAGFDGDSIEDGKKVLADLIPGDFYSNSFVAHSDYIWGKRYLNWARSFEADVMIEAAWCASATKMAAHNITCLEQLETI